MKILIVEDDENRIRYFKNSLKCDFDWGKTADEGIAFVRSNKYDMIFLDHDLGNRIFVDSEDLNTGFQVAKVIAESEENKDCEIIIHTMNPVGAQNMKSLLPNSTYIPFCFLNLRGDQQNV